MILRMSKLFPVFHLKERNQSTLICLNTILPILSTLSCVKIVSFLSSPKWASFMYQFLWSIWKVNDHHCFFCFCELTRPLWVNMDLTDPGIWLISRGGPPVDICNCMFWEELGFSEITWRRSKVFQAEYGWTVHLWYLRVIENKSKL